jgi:chorismate mutase-like protein
LQRLLRATALAALSILTACATANGPHPAGSANHTPEPPMTSKSDRELSPEEQKALLAPYRVKIDALDAQIVTLLGARFDVVRDVAALKAEHGIAPILPERIEVVVQQARAKAEKSGVDPKLVEQIYRIIIDAACQLETEYHHDQETKTR